jgi:hypothetical protein
MLKPIVAVAICILALMFVIKDGRLLRDAGLTGTCKVVATIADGSEVEQCMPGKLEGRPDLSRQGCTSLAFKAQSEYWRCPASVASSQAGR